MSERTCVICLDINHGECILTGNSKMTPCNHSMSIFLVHYLSAHYIRRDVEETGVPRETTDLSQVTDKLYHIMMYPVDFTSMGFELTTLLVKCTDYIGSYKSNYHDHDGPYMYMYIVISNVQQQ